MKSSGLVPPPTLEAKRVGSSDSILPRRKDRQTDPIAQSVIALDPAIRFEDIDDVPEAFSAGVEAYYYEAGFVTNYVVHYARAGGCLRLNRQ